MQPEELPQKRRLTRRTLVAAGLILIVIPAAILLGIYVLDDRKYYIISMAIIVCAMIPFVMIFEKRRPQTRELLVIAVLSAIAVAGRAAFFMLPQFKPVLAIVIITGVCFGGEAGFLTGAVSGFVSNFFFGQGPWTPWQMFSFGVIGFLAGVLFKKGLLKRGKLSLCIFGALAAFVIYGGIMNLASVYMVSTDFTWPVVLAVYASGVPFDLIHAAATVFFLLILSNPMIEKLERVRTKFGLIEE